MSSTVDTELERFIEGCLDALSHQVNGDSEPFLEVWSQADDVAILGAIGSHAVGWQRVRTHLLGASKSLDWTELIVERLVTTASSDLAMTVVLEHMSRSSEEPRTRTLRTTQVYRHEPGGWRLILRHANPVTAQDEQRERDLLGD